MDGLIGEDFWVYAFGALGYAIFVSSSYFKSRHMVLIMDMIGSFIVGVQWILLDAFMPGVLNFAYVYSSLCGLLLIKYDWVKHLYTLVFPVCIYMFFAYSQGALIDVASLVIGIVGLSSKYFTNMVFLRSLQVNAAAGWLVVNASQGVIAGILCNTGFILGHVKHLRQLYRERDIERLGIKALSPAV